MEDVEIEDIDDRSLSNSKESATQLGGGQSVTQKQVRNLFSMRFIDFANKVVSPTGSY